VLAGGIKDLELARCCKALGRHMQRWRAYAAITINPGFCLSTPQLSAFALSRIAAPAGSPDASTGTGMLQRGKNCRQERRRARQTGLSARAHAVAAIWRCKKLWMSGGAFVRNRIFAPQDSRIYTGTADCEATPLSRKLLPGTHTRRHSSFDGRRFR